MEYWLLWVIRMEYWPWVVMIYPVYTYSIDSTFRSLYIMVPLLVRGISERRVILKDRVIFRWRRCDVGIGWARDFGFQPPIRQSFWTNMHVRPTVSSYIYVCVGFEASLMRDVFGHVRNDNTWCERWTFFGEEVLHKKASYYCLGSRLSPT